MLIGCFCFGWLMLEIGQDGRPVVVLISLNIEQLPGMIDGNIERK